MMTRLAVLTFLLWAPTVQSAEPTYWADVRPLMRKHCTVCHSQKTIDEPDVSAGLALDSFDAIRKGGKSPIIGKGQGADSLLVTILRHPKPTRRMPLDAEPLADDAVKMLTAWIDAGLPEGTRPAESEPAIVTQPGNTRKLNIALPTKVPLPKLVARPNQTGPLELVLPVGPLPPITALAFSPDGKLLAAGCYGRVVVWDMIAGTPARMLTNVLGAVNDLKFSPDGLTLAVAGGQPSARGDIRLFATGDWKLTATLGGHLDVVSSVAYRHDGKQLASASFDKSVRIWDLATRRIALEFTGHSDFVHGVAFGPKGDWFVTASKDRTCRMVDAVSGKSILTFSGMDLDVLSVAVHPGGEQVVTSGFEPAMHWWNTKTGERFRKQNGHDLATHEIAFMASGDLAVSAGADKTVRLWDAKTGTQVKSFPVGSMAYSAAIRADGKLVASGSFDGIVRVWDPEGTRQVAAMLATPTGDWLIVTPEAFVNGSDPIVEKGLWKTTTQPLPADMNAMVRKAARQPDEIARALKLVKLGEPAFAVPAP